MYSLFDIMFMVLFYISILNISFACMDYGFKLNIGFLKSVNTSIPFGILVAFLFGMTPIYARSYTTEMKMQYMESNYSEIVIMNEPILK